MSDSLFLDWYCEKLAYNCSNLCLPGLQPHLKHSHLQPPDHCIQALLIPCTCNLLLLNCNLAT